MAREGGDHPTAWLSTSGRCPYIVQDQPLVVGRGKQKLVCQFEDVSPAVTVIFRDTGTYLRVRGPCHGPDAHGVA